MGNKKSLLYNNKELGVFISSCSYLALSKHSRENREFAFAVFENGKIGIIYEPEVGCSYKYSQPPREEIIAPGKYDAVVCNGKEISYNKEQPSGDFHDVRTCLRRHVIFKLGKKYVLFNLETRQETDLDFDSLKCRGGICIAKKTLDYFIILLSDAAKIKLNFEIIFENIDFLEDFNDFIIIKKNGKAALFRRNGTMIFPFAYESFHSDVNFIFLHKSKTQKGLAFREKVIFPPVYRKLFLERIGHWTLGLNKVSLVNDSEEKFYALFNKHDGTIIIPPQKHDIQTIEWSNIYHITTQSK